MPIVCKNCQTVFDGKFCNNCGQKHYSDRDKTFSHIFEEAVHFVTHLEGTLPRTVKAVLLQPGKLSQEYCFGIRKKYYKPTSFFLLLVVIYLLFPIATGLNQPMIYYKQNMLGGPLFESQIGAKMAELGLTEAELSKVFLQKAEKVSKLLLFLVIPLAAFSLKLLYWRNRRPMFDHFILATEVNSFHVLFLFLLVPLVVGPILNLLDLAEMADTLLFPVMLVLVSLYFFAALRRFYDEKWYWTIPKTAAFVLLFFFSVHIVYKAVLFEATMALL